MSLRRATRPSNGPCQEPHDSGPFLFATSFQVLRPKRKYHVARTAARPGRKGDVPRLNQSTGPKTPEGKRVCRLNAYRHGLTGQIVLLTPEEQQAYDNHTRIVLEALAPATDFERFLAQSIADDRWRLTRARAIESSMFALGMQSGVDDTGHPQVDDAFAQARTWIEEARNLNLLTIYEQRIQRAVDKNTVQLKAIQAERKESAE